MIAALIILVLIATGFAWCAFVVAGSADDDAVALQQLAARDHLRQPAHLTQRKGREVGGVGDRVHRESL